ncbi:MAG: caspase family protein [Caldilineaceae bacterium]
MTTESNLYALLVGVNDYKSPSVPDLRGCVADVRAMYTWLTTSLGLAPERITLLTSGDGEAADRRANRANILAAWTDLIARAGKDDQIFFHYSGHGAQARSIDPNEPDGYDETVVPYDSRDVDEAGRPVYDILDKELATLIDQAEAKGALVTVFLDCCHSGSGTREAEEPDTTKPLTRRGPKDERVRPPETLIEGVRLTDVVEIPTTRDGSGWRINADSQHVLLAGCRDEELSHEYRAPETGEWHGATTYFLIKSLRNYRPELTWGEVADFVQTSANAAYKSQLPQLEGPRNRQIFGGMAAPAAPHLLVTEVEDDGGQLYVRINGGAAVGLTEGSRVAIYPDGSDDMSGAPLAVGEVVQTKLDYVYAGLETTLTKDAIPVPARVRITAQGYDSLTYTVAVDDPLVLAALDSEEGRSSFLEVVAADEPGAHFRVLRRGDELAIQDGSGTQIVTERQPATPEGALSIAQNLHHLAVYNNVRNLRNPTEPDDLARGLTVTAQSYTSAGFAGPKDGIPLEDTGNVLTPGRKIWLTVQNDTSETLYVSIFNLDANFGIARISPSRATHHTLAPGKSIPIQGIAPTVNNPFITQSREILKIFATRAPTSFDVLEMEELNKPQREIGDVRDAGPLGELLNGIRRQRTRALRIEEDANAGWITRQVEINVLVDNDVRPLPEGERSLDLGSSLSITLEKPAGFSGDLVISSVGQITRALDADEAMPLPPGLTNPDAQWTFRPLSFGGSTRAAQSAAGVLALNTTPEQLSTINEDNPLRLEMTLEDEEDLGGVLPVAFDGEFFFLVYQSEEASTRALAGEGQRRLAVSITNLPLPVDAADGGTRTAGDVPTRDLKRTVRLFLYKVYKGKLPPDTGLRKAERGVDGKPIYAVATADDVAQARKVALLVHGFTSDTEWFVEKVMPFLNQLGGYDLYLAYDYETFNTTVMENGATLGQALTALNFGENDGVHLDVFCHSMGTQVVRVMVELKGGHAYVDRVFMGGAPNAGTRLAELKKLIFWLGTVALNHAGPTPPALIAEWFFKKTVDSAVSIDDLMPGSELYKELNNNADPLSVPYFVQIGNNAKFDKFNWKMLFSKAGLG